MEIRFGGWDTGFSDVFCCFEGTVVDEIERWRMGKNGVGGYEVEGKS